MYYQPFSTIGNDIADLYFLLGLMFICVALLSEVEGNPSFSLKIWFP